MAALVLNGDVMRTNLVATEANMGKKKGSDQKVSEARKEEIIRLFLTERPTLEEIGKRVGNVSKQYVSLKLREAGLLAEESEHVDVSKRLSEIRQLSGWSLTDIGLIMDVARETVSRWANGKAAASTYAQRLDLLAKGLHQATGQRPKTAAKR